MPANLTPGARARVEARELMVRAADAIEAAGGDEELLRELRYAAACCYDCGRQYGDEHGFPDLCVPHDVWAKITPTGHEGGLLCPSCMCKRAYDAGLQDVPGLFRSGPFALEYGATVAALVSEAVAAERARASADTERLDWLDGDAVTYRQAERIGLAVAEGVGGVRDAIDRERLDPARLHTHTAGPRRITGPVGPPAGAQAPTVAAVTQEEKHYAEMGIGGLQGDPPPALWLAVHEADRGCDAWLTPERVYPLPDKPMPADAVRYILDPARPHTEAPC